MPLTKEQQAIINCEFDEILLINAYAGTGKTTTLVEFCKKRSDKKIIYMAYNNSMSKEAQIKFKDLHNVSVGTIHSFARKEMQDKITKISNYDRKAKNEQWIINANTIKSLFLDIQVEFRVYYASLIIKQLKAFSCSNKDLQDYINNLIAIKSEVEKYNVNYLAKKMIELWREFRENQNIPYEHDFYLKEWQLTKPQLNADYILVDEAQDINDCIIDIILNQKHTKKVFIGDSYQSIYGFRGAKDCLTKLIDNKNSILLHLTKSFRCPLSVSNLANNYLSLLGAKKDFIGTKRDNNNKETFKAVISRTNARLFDYAIEAIKENKKIAWVGGLQKYNFQELIDIQQLIYKKPQNIYNNFLNKFNNINELLEYSKEANEPDLKTKLSIVFKYINKDILSLIKKIKAMSLANPKNADYVLCTAHKSKGLEWENVVLLDDFINLSKIIPSAKEKNSLFEIQKEELNLLYVAITRSKKRIELPNDYILSKNLILEAKEYIDLI